MLLGGMRVFPPSPAPSSRRSLAQPAVVRVLESAWVVHLAIAALGLAGCSGEDRETDARGELLAVITDPLIAVEQAKLTTDDPEAGSYFGSSVVVSGDTALVGALGDSGNDQYQGAYVFARAGEAWTEQAKLTVEDGDVTWFGAAVALSGETALVGQGNYPLPLSEGPQVQGAHVFVRSGSAWSQQARLLPGDWPPASMGGLGFGEAVGLEGDTAIVLGQQGGAAYVFQRSGAAWTEQGKLVPSDAPVVGSVGAVSLSGATAIVSSAGAAHVFQRSGAIWSEQAKLVTTDAEPCFGFAVALLGDTAIVGAPCEADAGTNFGSAYVFVRQGTTWSEQAKLTASDAAPQGQFGSSVAISGETVLVGAKGFGERTGHAYVFQRNVATWSETARFGASDGVPNDGFGRSVSLSGDTALLGAGNHDVTPGSAYVVLLAGDPAGGGGSGGGGTASSGTAGGGDGPVSSGSSGGGEGLASSSAASDDGSDDDAATEDGCGCRAAGERGDDPNRGAWAPALLLGIGLLWRRPGRRTGGA